MRELKENDKELTNYVIAKKFGELILKPISTVTQEDLEEIRKKQPDLSPEYLQSIASQLPEKPAQQVI